MPLLDSTQFLGDFRLVCFTPKQGTMRKFRKKQSRISSFDDPTTLLDTTLSSRKNEISFLPRVSGTRTTSKYLHTPSISVSNFSDFAPFQVQISSSFAMVASTARLVKYLPNSSFRMTQLKKRILKSFLSLKNTEFFFFSLRSESLEKGTNSQFRKLQAKFV